MLQFWMRVEVTPSQNRGLSAGFAFENWRDVLLLDALQEVRRLSRFAQPMVDYSEHRKRRSAPKVRLIVQNNHALRAHGNLSSGVSRSPKPVVRPRKPVDPQFTPCPAIVS